MSAGADASVDWLVVGSGAAGLAAAVTAAHQGLRVAVIDKDSVLGGTTAWSGGCMWLPVGGLEGSDSDPVASKNYLRAHLPPEVFRRHEPKIDLYLKNAPEVIKFFGKHASAPLPLPLDFEVDRTTPDFKEPVPGKASGRAVRVRAFDGRRLGRHLEAVRRPMPEFTFAGYPLEAGDEVNHFLNVHRDLRSTLYVVWRLAGYLWERLVHGRSMRMVNGNALVGSLLAAAHRIEAGAPRQPAATDPAVPADPFKDFKRIAFFAGHAARGLIRQGDKVVGVRVAAPDGERELTSNYGVLLACGGFPHDIQRRRELFPHAPAGHEHWTAAPPANTGDGLRMAEAIGARVRRTDGAPAVWAPVSLYPRRDGSTGVYAHFVDRAKPGVIAVNRQGRRFCDEAAPYHDVVDRWIATSPSDGPLEAWLICDRCFLWRYGLGVVTPLTLWRALRTGYLKMGRTLESLAKACGVESQGLRKTVAAYNANIKNSQENDKPPQDPQYQRGISAWDQSQGERRLRGEERCVAPVERGPFFAVRLYPGSLGTFAGLDTDETGQVLDAAGRPIAGLRACGNDMAPAMAGFYPSSGITLGSAMIFGHLAALEVVKARAAATGKVANPSPVQP